MPCTILGHVEADTHRRALARVAELEAALKDCIGMVAVYADRYRREFGLPELHPTHARILDHASTLTGGDVLSTKLKE